MSDRLAWKCDYCGRTHATDGLYQLCARKHEENQ